MRGKGGLKAVWNLIENAWVQIKIAFDVRDDFRRASGTFELPADIQTMSPDRKRRLTLCNLFANHGQSIKELAIYFSMERSRVVSILIQEGLLQEQRRQARGPIRGGRRESDKTRVALPRHQFVLRNSTQQSGLY
jgi:hypothetical protein